MKILQKQNVANENKQIDLVVSIGNKKKLFTCFERKCEVKHVAYQCYYYHEKLHVKKEV